MSRHRRQQRRRYRVALSSVLRTTSARDHFGSVCFRVENTGRFPYWASPLERIAYKAGLRVETQFERISVDRPIFT